LYHCVYCRYQFYDLRELASVSEPKISAPKVDQPEVTEAASSKSLNVSADPPEIQCSVQSHIGGTVQVMGSVSLGEDLYIEGMVNGELDSPKHRVTVGPNARVEASIRARELIVQGHLSGVLQVAGTVILGRAAIVTSNIRAGTIEIEGGAHLRGNLAVQGHVEAGINTEIENLAASIAAPVAENMTDRVRSD
jgi:cytoskeletal protein CcmA (bactofilin family)